jgi:hypothetical protein
MQLVAMKQSAVSQAIFDRDERVTRIKIMDYAPKIVKKEDKNAKKLKRSRQRRKSAHSGDQSEKNSEYGGGISDDGQSVMSGAQYANIINQELNAQPLQYAIIEEEPSN